MKKYVISLLFFSGFVFPQQKQYDILCTAIIDGERTCFVEGTTDGRITFTIPCDCDCVEYADEEEIEEAPEYVEDYEYPPEELISTITKGYTP